MKKFFYVLSCHVIMAFSALSCSQNEKHDTVTAQIDSLTSLTLTQQAQISNMESFITSIAETMDSIDAKEKDLLNDGALEKKDARRKQEILNNLQRYKETIEKQKSLINQLEQQLALQKGEMSEKMLQIVAFYKKELEAKDATIASLKADIESNKRDIKFLRSSVDELMTTTKEMGNTIKEQEQVLTTQTAMINTCYVKIGTKKELKAAGLLSGGFLQKKKLDTSKIRKELFTEMDMRKCNELIVNSSAPKILTQMPASSYEFIKKDNDKCYLHIISPNEFWSISRFLIIQI